VQGFCTPFEIFTDDVGTPEFEAYHDIGMGALSHGWAQPGVEGQQVSIQGYSSAAVSVLRGEYAHDPFKLAYRWLQGDDEGSTGEMSEIGTVTGWDESATHRAPKCDAIFMLHTPIYNSIIELAVCYQVRGIPDDDVDEVLGENFHQNPQYPDPDPEGWGESNDDWDIGLTILRWTQEEFPEGQLQRIDYLIPDDGYLSQWGDFDPDLAYDHFSGDLYIVFSDAQTPGGVDRVFVKCVKLTRDNVHYPWYLDTTCWVENHGWVSGWPALVQPAPGGIPDHNGHDPSIDIGLLDFFIEGPPGQPGHWLEDRLWTAVSYTSQFEGGHCGYHVMAGGWPDGDLSSRFFWPLRQSDPGNPALYELDSGLSCIDITPNQNDRNFAAVVFVQQEGGDCYGPVMMVYEVDLFGLGQVIQPTPGVSNPYYRVTTEDFADGLFPSISLHYGTGTSGPFYASITYMAQIQESNGLQPGVMRLEIEPVESLYPPKLRVNHEAAWGPYALDSVITGNYNISQIPFIEPGMSTAILAFEGDYYWGVWCNRIEMESPPVTVWGTYGYTGI
jgi:hypothetical protein